MRRWMIAGTLGALVAAGVVLVLNRDRAASAQGVTLDRSLVALLPQNATSLVGVDVERLKQTPAYRHFEEQSRRSGDTHFDEFVHETGFDPRRDVSRLLVASTGLEQFVAVAQGTFNVANLTRVLREKGATVESYRGFDLFGPDGNARRRNNEGRFVFLDGQTVLAGSRPEVLAALDRKAAGGPSLANNTALLGRAQQISGTHQVWAVSDDPGQLVRRNLRRRENAGTSAFARIFQSMRKTSFALDLMNGLDLRAFGVCATAQDAKTLADAARGAVAIGRLTASEQEPELLSVFDGIQVEERANELGITVRLDAQSFDKLLEKAGPRGRRGRTQAE